MAFVIETQIPFGNACDIEVKRVDGRSEVSFGPDPHGGPETLWFCLRVRCVSSGDAAGPHHPGAEDDGPREEEISLVLKHSHNMLGGNLPNAIRPVVRYGDGQWTRLPEGDLIPLPDGRHNVRWRVVAPDDTLDIAYCYPYGRDEVRALIAETTFSPRRGPYWHVDTIGVSQAARPLWRLSNHYGDPDAAGTHHRSAGTHHRSAGTHHRQYEHLGLYVMSRQHSGETPGSWVLDGFLRHIATLGDDAPLVWGVPLANMDGVEGGDYGKDNFPYDLNRAWGRPPMRHEISVYQWDMARWRDRCRPVLGIDFHAPGACETSGVYAYVPDPDSERAAYNAVIPWAERTGDALTQQYAAQPFAKVPRYPSRWETPSFRAYGWSQLGVPMITFETPYAMAGTRVLTQADYREIGRRIALGVLQGLEAL